MNLFWALLILLVAIILLFGIMPSIMKEESAPSSVMVSPANGWQVPMQDEIEQKMAQEMLDQHYSAAKEIIPENYPVKPIGACPFSKPMSSDLPLADVPLCMIQKSVSPRLSDLSIN